MAMIATIGDSRAPVYGCFVAAASLSLLVSALLLGCATAPPPRPAAEEAAEMERARCGPDVQEEALAPVFAPDTVEGAEPFYTAAPTGGRGVGGNYSRLTGASIKLRAVKGFTAEWLDRALECHSARRVLGQIPATTLPDDPFWLPDRMVRIEVAATHAGFQVFVRGQSIKDAEEILARANAFVEARAHR
jgi:hypothetical protein